MSLLHIGSELRRFGHGKIPRVAIVVVMLLPLLFGGLFVWAYYDPLGNLNKLPVALVNSDEGATGPDGHLNVGDKVVEGLLDAKPLDFRVTSAEDARRGVEDGTYYFAVELPRDFSQAAVSASSDNPHTATLNVAFNNRNGFIPTTLGNQASLLMVNQIGETLGEQVVNKLLLGFNTIGEGLGQATDGAEKIHNGSTQAKDGTQRLSDGAQQLDHGVQELHSGAQQLDNGAQRLDEGLGKALDGSTQLADGLAQLQAATDRLGDGATQIADGVDRIGSVADNVEQAQQQVLAPLINISSLLRSSPVPGAGALADQTDQAIAQVRAAGLNSNTMSQLQRLQEGARIVSTQLSDPVSQYRSGMDRAAQGAKQLNAGLIQLKDGSSQLVIGTHRLVDGTSRLSEGTQQLTVGAVALRDGLVQLDDGSGELALRLGQSQGKVPTWEGKKADDASAVISAPVSRNLTMQEATLFGVGLAPFFLALATFFGGVVIFMLMNPLQRRPVDSGATPLRAVQATYIPAVCIGMIQMTLVWFVQHFLIAMPTAHPYKLLLSMWVISAIFVGVVQAINALIGATAGRVICMALMSLQLVSSGGLYPVETQPRFIQWFHNYDPMTYAVTVYRQLIIGDIPAGDNRLGSAVMVLVFIGFCAFAVSVYSAWKHRIIAHKDLHPEVQP